MRKVNVLGTEYEILFRKEADDQKLEQADGYTEPYAKKIVIKDIIPDKNTVDRLEVYKKKVFRHEIVHAFLMESGLDVNSEWARNEEIVDWIAIQFPKMLKAFQEVKCI